ncbi:hypothetical protein MMH89_00455 [Candidatus Comchoanobacter bicostacola]|uniref:Uncharacterized protein n=1 Tax=Candidatus Comchoanobacter bicostacola TaxID=2919598 RepID=A0ABY5DLI7_9GAMM|nr:hypothetical protein [Candidatus Comchoanobacter bicostacola]UTC24637.1 hypothetical protein MMH89_00455 [Candidatus Comchoanobacter bicostacola]
MINGIILHRDTLFSRILQVHHPKKIVAISVTDLINEVKIRYCLHTGHLWAYRGKEFNISDMFLYQEVFFSLGIGLAHYAIADQDYVECAWQSYLLSVQASCQTINPITPAQMSVSTYQTPNLLMLAKKAGLQVPRYSLFEQPNYLAQGYNKLWFQPHTRWGKVLYLEQMNGVWYYVPFSYHPDYGLRLTMELPDKLVRQLTSLVLSLSVYFGEFYFKYNSGLYTFYGLSPVLSESKYRYHELNHFAKTIMEDVV